MRDHFKMGPQLVLNKRLSPNVLTSAFESKGRGMPRPLGHVNPTQDYTFITVVSGNTIIGANRGYAGAVINVRNVGSWRASTEIVISGNKWVALDNLFQVESPFPPDSIRRFSRRRCFTISDWREIFWRCADVFVVLGASSLLVYSNKTAIRQRY